MVYSAPVCCRTLPAHSAHVDSIRHGSSAQATRGFKMTFRPNGFKDILPFPIYNKDLYFPVTLQETCTHKPCPLPQSGPNRLALNCRSGSPNSCLSRCSFSHPQPEPSAHPQPVRKCKSGGSDQTPVRMKTLTARSGTRSRHNTEAVSTQVFSCFWDILSYRLSLFHGFSMQNRHRFFL